MRSTHAHDGQAGPQYQLSSLLFGGWPMAKAAVFGRRLAIMV